MQFRAKAKLTRRGESPRLREMVTLTKVFWLFGRSGAGKTTLARRLHQGLTNRNIPVFYLDGDEMRSGVSADLGFTPEARLENHRRIAEVARLAADQGFNVVVSTMAPQHDHRDVVARVLANKLVWFYIHALLETCIQRDPKGLYSRAKSGEVKQLLNFPFDEPRPAERENHVNTLTQTIEDSYQSILGVVNRHLADFVI
jgi:adenylyl-sulfate kinase